MTERQSAPQRQVSPCPFCGATWGTGLTAAYGGQPATSWHIHCSPCRVSGPRVEGGSTESIGIAIDLWNRRTPPSERGTSEPAQPVAWIVTNDRTVQHFAAADGWRVEVVATLPVSPPPQPAPVSATDAPRANSRDFDAGLEEAARVCDEEAALSYDLYREIRLALAHRIRALKSAPADGRRA